MFGAAIDKARSAHGVAKPEPEEPRPDEGFERPDHWVPPADSMSKHDDLPMPRPPKERKPAGRSMRRRLEV
jgi:hypothetical protein